MVPTCSSDTLTTALPYRNAMPQTQGMTPHPVTVYRHRANLSCYQWMWNITLEYTTSHLNVLGQTPIGKSFLDLPHTPVNIQLYVAGVVAVSQKLGRKFTLPTGS